MSMEATSKKKKKPWRRARHRVLRFLFLWAVLLYARLKYHIKAERFPDAKRRQFLVMMNHQTAFDQFFIEMIFHTPVYYLASEDLFSNGWISRLIEYVVAPIPIRKSVTDMKAVRICARVAKEGGTIALAPEGNRTYSGVTESMKSSIVGLVRLLRLPVAVVRIEGGYGVHPRWSDVVRRGSMKAGVRRVIEPEEAATMSDDELFALIRRELWVDDTATGGEYHHKKRAEYLERVLYYCPACGVSRFESHGDVIQCTRCSLTARYLPDLKLEGVDRLLPYAYFKDWYRAQEAFVSSQEPEALKNICLREDTVDLYRVNLYHNKDKVEESVRMALYGDRIELVGAQTQLTLSFDEISVISVLGRNKLNIYIGDELYQIKGNPRYNAVVYTNFYYHYQNVKRGETDGEFLGL